MTTKQRPAEFDANVMAYLPGLKNLSRRYCRDRDERNDLVTDTIAHCLQNWEKYRDEGGLWAWMAWGMRGIASNKRDKRTIEIVDDPTGYFMETASIDPCQETCADVSIALRRAVTPSAIAAIRSVMGYQLREMADERGVSRQRIDQMILRGYAEMRGDTAWIRAKNRRRREVANARAA